MLVVVVIRTVVLLVACYVLIYTQLLLLWSGTLALPCHSNQYVAHYACRGGASRYGANCGMSYVFLHSPATITSWNFSVSLSFKPILIPFSIL